MKVFGRRNKKKTVYAYLVADVFHIGHLKFLQNAKKEGDYLIAGILTDEACMEKKPRPIIPYEERKAIVKSLGIVNKVVGQREYSPLKNIKKFKPKVLMESDSHKEMPGNRFVEGYGGIIVVAPYYEGQSSTSIKKKIIRKAL